MTSLARRSVHCAHPLSLWLGGWLAGCAVLLTSLQVQQIVLLPCAAVLLAFPSGRLSLRNLACVLMGYFYAVLSFEFAQLKIPDGGSQVMQQRLLRLSLSKERALVSAEGGRAQLYRSVSCHHASSSVVSIKDGVVWCLPTQASASLRSRVRDALRTFLLVGEYPVMGWIYSTLSGDASELHPSYRALLRHWGIAHLQAVSGFHLLLVLAFLRGVGALMHGLLRVIPGGWRALALLGPRSVALVVCHWSAVLFWLYLVAFPASALRAFLCYVSFLILRSPAAKWFSRSSLSWLILPLSAFAALAPLDFFSLSSALSWSAYLLLLTLPRIFSDPRGAGPLRRWTRIIAMVIGVQVGFMVLGFFMVAEVSALALPGNVLLLPALVLMLKMVVLIQLCGILLGAAAGSFQILLAANDHLGAVLTAGFQGLEHMTHGLFRWMPVMFFHWQIPQFWSDVGKVCFVVLFAFIFCRVHGLLPMSTLRRSS